MKSAALNATPDPDVEFHDGLGDRYRLTDRASGEPLEILRLRPGFFAVPSFEPALRERVSRLVNFRHTCYARVRRIDRLEGGALGVVSDAVSGARLSRILEIADAHDLVLDINAALCLMRQIVPAVAMLHQNARDVAHGVLSPERLIVTPHARVVVTEYVLGSAIEQLQFGRERLWNDLRVAAPSGAGPARLNHRADVMQLGVIGLALILGRPLGDEDYRSLQDLMAGATESTALGRQPLSASLRRWLARALQIDARGAFESALEAQLALDDVLSDAGGYVAAPVALETFLARYEDCAARPMPVRASAAPVVEEPERPAPVLVTPQKAVRAPEPPAPSRKMPAPEPEPEPVRPAAETLAPPVTPAPSTRPPRKAEPPPRFDPIVVPDPVAAMVEPVGGAVSEAFPDRASVRTPAGEAAPADPPAPTVPRLELVKPPRVELASDLLGIDGAAAAGIGAEPVAGPSRFGRLKTYGVALLAFVALAEGAFIWWKLGDAFTVLPSGTLQVESRPSGASVKIDGELRGATPLTLTLGTGAHVVEISAGGEPRVIPINIAGGRTLAQYVELLASRAVGGLRVTSQPAGATVYLDGQPRGTSPVDLDEVPAGEHEIVLELGAQRVRQAVTVVAGATATVAMPLSASGSPAPDAVAADAPGWIAVRVPVEMQVFEGGVLLGTTANARLPLAPGPHQLEIVSEALAFRTTRTVEVAPGRGTRVDVPLPEGVMHLNATPWAEVWIDGQRVGETPIGNLAVPIGPHEIVFKHPDHGERRHAATVTTAEPVRLSVDLTRP